MDKWTIWNSEPDLKDFEDFFAEEYPEATESEKWALAEEMNGEYLEDERINLGGIVAKNGIIVFRELGLWDGTHYAVSIDDGGKLAEHLQYRYDGAEWYCDKNDMWGAEWHHDGCNHYLYRALKPGLSDVQLGNLIRKAKSGTLDRKTLCRYTTSLRPQIAAVYGWPQRNLGGRPKKVIAENHVA